MPTGGGVPLLGVVKWKGEVWVAAGPQGLLKRKGVSNVFEQLPDMQKPAFSLDAREDLLICTGEKIGTTKDGVKFSATATNSLEKMRQGKELFDY
jgi:hypothetical protein